MSNRAPPPRPDGRRARHAGGAAGAARRVAACLHPTIEAKARREAGHSRRACILASLVARDALRRLGLPALVAAAIFRVRRRRRGAPTRELIIGSPDLRDEPGFWNGHMVVLCEGWLLDFTLLQARASGWPRLPAMLAAPLRHAGEALAGRFPRLAAVTCVSGAVDAVWFSRAGNTSWRAATDADPRVREAAVRKLVSTARKHGLG
jgi:hypothetical protein